MEIDFREIVITTIGREAQSDETDDTFDFQSKAYKILLQWPHFDKLLDLNRGSGFYLQVSSIEEKDHVVLCYSNSSIMKSLAKIGRKDRLFLANAFFDVVDSGDDSMPTAEANPDARQLTMDEFYERLRVKHLDDDLDTGIPTEVQHSSLRPVLRPYQKKGIRWMLSRELVPNTLPKHWIKLRSKFNQSQELYFNKHTQLLVSECPELQPIPKGGLLTDEMGLGKTVEVMGLILMNPYRAGNKRKASEIDENDSPSPFESLTTKISINAIKCICHKFDSRKTVLTCTMCSKQQHGMCVFRREVTADDQVNYICPFCWKFSGRVIDAKATIVVTPASIKSQWMDEIQRHVADKSFKVFMYEGISSGWVHPTELVKYDVILTDFYTLSRELYFSDRDAEERSFRRRKKYVYPPSPLTSIRWWRVVLDEAQMVENKQNRPSQMVKQLPSVHRWATTGTPIEKDSLQCLYGLLFYLNLDPFTSEDLFNQMYNEYQSGNHDDLINVVSTVMWRTCKKNVEHEINIPKQSEIVHEVAMTDLQEYYYRQAHTQTRPQFMKNVQDYLLRNGPFQWVTKEKATKTVTVRERTVDITMKNACLYMLNNANIKVFLEPLRSLRQDCTIPSKTYQLNDQTKVKAILRPEQLHEHLVKKTSLETKSALRTVCSSINGLAAIKLAENKYQDAIALYNQVLKLAVDYDKFVDSMLQIHAYNGLLDIAALTDEKNKNHENYASEMARLEWKYISSYYEKVEEINEELREHEPEMKKTKKDLVDAKGDWWRDIISIRRTGEEDCRLMEIINTECFQSVTDNLALLENVRTTHGIALIITEWCDKIQRYIKEVNKRFNNLDFVVNNLRPSNEMNAEEADEICKLTQAALICHLNLLDEEDDTNEDENRKPRAKAKPTRQVFCDLCKLKAKLDEFECLLFNKSLGAAGIDGSWNPRFEEKLLKAVLTYARRSQFEDETLEMGNYFFKHLEAIKTQYKIHAKLWVEVNYTVSAYDELKMCKTRMQVVASPEDITEEEARFRMKIARYQVPEQTQIFISQKQEAEIKFVRINGRLKYLEHLKERNETQPCPICSNIPQERYYVTVCGHTICAQCLGQMIRNHSRYINCPVCRTVQETKNIYAVTCTENSSLELINGSFSPKIDEMVRCILRLTKDEPHVKILIFSHWDQILQVIATALKSNNIEFRASMNSNFTKQVKEFKSFTTNVTCLLLNLKFGGKGLNLIEATHVFLVEPILNADEEMQAIGRVHRIGQTRETFVHRFITQKTIEETIHSKIIQEREKWARKEFTIKDLEELLDVNTEEDMNADDSLEYVD